MQNPEINLTDTADQDLDQHPAPVGSYISDVDTSSEAGDPDDDLNEEEPPVTEFDLNKAPDLFAKVERARYTLKDSSSSGRPTSSRRLSQLQGLNRVLSNDDGIDDSEIASQGAYQHKTTHKLAELERQIASQKSQVELLSKIGSTFESLEARLGTLEMQSAAWDGVSKTVDTVMVSQGKVNDTLEKLQISHTQSYESILARMSQLENAIKRAVGVIEAAVEVNASSDDPQPDRLVQVRQVLKDSISERPTAAPAAEEKKVRAKKPAWLS